ncbi:hypothetical protein HAPG_00008 [Halorubrum phage GNf2]|nr:hypothetical protein HAPG_00008 [Halorubrum phage GNf2]
MALPDFAITNDEELKTAVRDATSYDDAEDGIPEAQLDGLVERAKRHLYGKTGSDEWYNDVNYGQSLESWTAIIVKAAVENINIDQYDIANESISLTNADPDDSQQIRLWMGEYSRSLKQSDVSFSRTQDLSFSNTSSYIG